MNGCKSISRASFMFGVETSDLPYQIWESDWEQERIVKLW